MTTIKSFKSLGTNKSLLALVILSFLLVIADMMIMTSYLAYNESRIGIKLYDPIIYSLPAIDLNMLIFVVTYGCIAVGILCSMTTPERIVRTNLSIVCMHAFRIACMYLLPLEAPENIIALEDVFLAYTTYGDQVIVKDLFFSGHTASVVLLSYLVDHKAVSRTLFVLSMILGAMLVLQHVHYTVDVLFAYAFAHLAFLSGTWLADRALLYTRYLFLYPARAFFPK